MSFVDLFREELRPVWPRFIAFAALSGLSNAAVLAIINAAAAAERDVLGRAIALLLLSVVIYVVAQKGLIMLAASIAEQSVDGLRRRFIVGLQSAELQEVEGLDRSSLYTAMGGEMQVLSDGALNLIIVGQAAVLLVVTMVYIATLSLTALALALVFVSVGVSFHLSRAREIGARLAASFQLETRLLDGFTDFIDGFREVKQSAARAADLTDGLRRLSSEVASTRLQTRELFASDFVASQTTFFLLTAMMVFVVPLFGDVDRATIIKITTTSLFLIGPISTVVAGFPLLQRVDAAAGSVLAVERHLKRLTRSAAGPVQTPPFRHIALRGVTFRYGARGGDGGFEVGPLDLDLSPGRVTFITGGNGSGKSTLLKLLTGLYKPADGQILLNEAATDDASYREVFAVIFSDNYLFRRLYGLWRVDAAKAAGHLETVELAHKVSVVDRGFSTVALSSGQRKRLAMVAALLEDRQVYVFDEWAADQDPHFREKFYTVIIPDLIRRGKTVVAVTHDERYFQLADQRLHMTLGKLEAVVPTPAPPAG